VTEDTITTAVADRRAVLEAFDRAVAREAHNLARLPELTWQQLHNRLQSEGVEERLAAERERRSARGSGLWLRTSTPFRESRAAVRALPGHRDSVRACAVSPDGLRIVSAGDDRILRVWDAREGVEFLTLEHDRVKACAFAAQGRLIVAPSYETVQLWDTQTGASVGTVGRHEGSVTACAVGPDGSWIVSIGEHERTLKLWDLETGAELRSFSGHQYSVEACVVGPDGRSIVSAGASELKLWETNTGAELPAPPGHCQPVAFSPDGSFVVSARHHGKTLVLWDPSTGDELRSLGPGSWAWACSVSPDGSFIVSAHGDGTVKMWDAGTGAELRTLAGHSDQVLACAIGPDASFIVSGSKDGTLRVWSAQSEGDEPAPTGHDGRVDACAVSPDGSFVVIADAYGEVKVWDVHSREEIHGFTAEAWDHTFGYTTPVGRCAVAPDGSFAVSANGNGSLKVWESRTGAELRTLGFHRGNVYGCAVSPGGTFIVSASGDGTLKLWDAATGEELRTLAAHQSAWDCAVAADGRRIASAGSDEVKLWDAGSGELLRALRRQASVWPEGCTISPDGDTVVSSAWGKLELWDAERGDKLRTLEGHGGYVWGVAFSPDGSFVVSVGEDATLKVWDVQVGYELAMLPLLSSGHAVACHPTSPLLVCGDAGGAVYFVDLIGIDYGPIIVSGVATEDGHRLRCPKCWHQHSLDEAWLGQVIDCPTPTCDLRLRVNPFVATTKRKGLLKQLLGRKGRS
jgi:WD40 repeat protein